MRNRTNSRKFPSMDKNREITAGMDAHTAVNYPTTPNQLNLFPRTRSNDKPIEQMVPPPPPLLPTPPLPSAPLPFPALPPALLFSYRWRQSSLLGLAPASVPPRHFPTAAAAGAISAAGATAAAAVAAAAAAALRAAITGISPGPRQRLARQHRGGKRRIRGGRLSRTVSSALDGPTAITGGGGDGGVGNR